MRNILISFALLCFLFVTGCSKESGSPSQVIIKGHFSAVKSTGSSANLMSYATKVIVFDQSSDYTLSDIVDGSFSVQVDRDKPVGLVFTDENGSFQGYLTLNHGFESIPLDFLNDSVAAIDFGLLEKSVQTVVPSNDFVIDKFNMTPEFVKSYAQASINFSALIRNPDVNGNGKIDILENKHYVLSYLYFVDGGTFSNESSPARGSVNLTGYRLMLNTRDANPPDNITFILSNGTRVNTNQKKTQSEDGSTMYFSDLLDMNSLQFGSCKILFGSDTLSFDVSDQTGTINDLIYIYPKFTFDANNKLTGVSWDYYLGNSMDLDPNSYRIVNKVQIQIAGTDYNNRLYDSPNFDPEIKQTSLPTPIDLNQIGIVWTTYYNNFGNNVVIEFRHSL